MMREERISRRIVLRKRKENVVLHGPVWRATGGRAKKNGRTTIPFSMAPKEGDAAVVIPHGDIRDLCNALQRILATEGKG